MSTAQTVKVPDVMQKYYEYYINEYKKIIGLQGLLNHADKYPWLREAVKNFKSMYSSIWRHEGLSILKYYIIPQKTRYICSLFKISRLGSTSLIEHPIADQVQYHTTYAFMYSSVNPETNELLHEFIVDGYTLISADGEYRPGFIMLEQFLNSLNAYKDVNNLIEEHFIKQISEEKVSLTTEMLFPPEFVAQQTDLQNKIISFIDKHRLAIYLYCVSWLSIFQRYQDHTIDNNISKGYLESMLDKSDPIFWETNKEIFNDPIKYNYGRFTYYLKHSKQVLSYETFGQKLIPITINQLEDIFNIKHGPWMELLVISYVGDLIINGIAPGFPLSGQWFFIQGAKRTMYDNQVMHIKYNHSEKAFQMIKDLETVRKGTYLFDNIQKKKSI